MDSQLLTLSSQLRGRRRGGFALLIVVTLLAFIVLLLVGLAAFTRVETSIAGNTQRQAQARENALLALNVALGQLQKHAGPDQRATAAGEGSGNVGAKFLTGVWDSTTSPAAEPVTWLVSGSELPSATANSVLSAALNPATPTTGIQVFLVGNNTVASNPVNPTPSELSMRIKVTPQPLFASAVPGAAPTGPPPTIGRYAWWIGDQGLKAPVAVPDATSAINYAPFDSGETMPRIRQQVPLGASATDSSGGALFDSRDAANAPLMRDDKLATFNQLAFARQTTTPASAVGIAAVRPRFHDWSPDNLAVLADTQAGGLRIDLSLKPDALSPEFKAWAGYGDYTEIPTNTAEAGETATIKFPSGSPLPKILPAYAEIPVRRRHRLQGVSSMVRIAPVLSFFGLSFSLRNDSPNAPTALEVSARCVIGLWNPYTAALVPEDLQVVIKGLPDHVHLHDSLTGSHRHVNLQTLMRDQASGEEMKLLLPFTPDGMNPDRSSWLPGRVYNWSAESDTADPADGKGKRMVFYERAAAQTGPGIVRTIGAPLPAVTPTGGTVNRWCEVNGDTLLTIELLRASDGEKLGEFQAPLFSAFQTDRTRLDTSDRFLDFAFIFRLPDMAEVPGGQTNTWLQAAGRDPREMPFPSSGYVGPGFGVNGNGVLDPALLIQSRKTNFDASYPDLLLDRDPGTGVSYNEDVPVFELPRAPLLTLGALQHMPVSGSRPFATGNSWGGSALNAVFDRHFLSGLTQETKWSDVAASLPNPLLRVIKRKVDGTPTLTDDLNGPLRIADGLSSKHLLQRGAFNLNSTSKQAWAAVLRSVRMSPAVDFSILDSDSTTGTAPDTVVASQATLVTGIPWAAAFARFAQSAQEVFKSDEGYQQSVFGGNGPVIDTPAFRRGIQTLPPSMIDALAQSIRNLILVKHADSGPFRTMVEFLGASALFIDASGNQVSLLEKAIEDAGINAAKPGFSSQWLTQADIMTALAPVLFPRSDTFLIRAYGEAVNPATNATEGRAWCEALVQRIPEYFDPTNEPEISPGDPAFTPLNQANGRRFKVVSFRWLTRSDI